MNIDYIDEFTMDIYVKKIFLNNIDFENTEEEKSYLKDLFLLLKNKYNITIEGFYDITIYIDKYYGIVIHMQKENIEYYNYYKNQVDMKISIENTEFLYKINDIPNSKKYKIIIDNDNIYLKIIEELSDSEMMYLLENSEIVYKKID